MTGSALLAREYDSGVVTLTLNGGMLDMTGHPIGSNPYGSTVTNNYLDVLNFLAGTLQNVGQLNNGSVPMVKNGPGTLTLSGISTYTGGTVVSNGTLIVNLVGCFLIALIFQLATSPTMISPTMSVFSSGHAMEWIQPNAFNSLPALPSIPNSLPSRLSL